MQKVDKVIGIDPGYGRMGVAVIEKKGADYKLLYSCCIETDSKTDFPDRLHYIGKTLTKIIKDWQPEKMAIENLFVNKNQKTITGVYQARGVAVYLGKTHNLSIAELAPQEIKTSITGYGKSDKGAVSRMVNTIFDLKNKGSLLDDEIDAIAVAYSGFFY